MNEYLKDKDIKHPQYIKAREMTFAVEDCARCKGSHDSLVAKTFAVPLKRSGYYSSTYNYWLECPNTHEPIVFNLKVEQMEEGWLEKTLIYCCICRDEDSEILDANCGCKCHGEEE